MSGFRDYFSACSDSYRRFRPRYPPRLFDWLAEVAPDRDLAWDCACGSGQASHDLSARFARVVASDASLSQLAGAERKGLALAAARAEACPLATARFALVTVAQAAHWLDLDRFYDEVRRVARPAAVLAIWTYDLLRTEPAIDRELNRFHDDVVGGCWTPERRWVDEGYRSLPFPFPELEVPEIAMQAEWSATDLEGYVGSWSAVRRYRRQRGADPVPLLMREVAERWGRGRRRVRWNLRVRAGRIG